jgi:hypothetical protein
MLRMVRGEIDLEAGGPKVSSYGKYIKASEEDK